jgi:hypothetical protein
MSVLELDYMEYATHALAQAAYVMNDTTYGNTGGTITTDGLYKVHTFKLADSGTAFTPSKSGNVQYLVVGGGGGGAGGVAGGGGGGGGFRTATGFAVTVQAYTITVGAGGAVHTAGGDSTFSTITSPGGGKGGNYVAETGGNGGCGGGGGATDGVTGSSAGGSGSYGANGGGATSVVDGGGGGGGATSAGSNGSGSGNGGNGGNGTASNISGSSVTYAGGGGGGNRLSGTGNGGNGGSGGGGNGSGANHNETAGTDDLGGGGGGIGLNTGLGTGEKGGSGVVIIRCLASDFVGGGLQSYSEPTIKTQGSYSLKGVATITASLNKTLTRTVSPVINLTDKTIIAFDIRASRTGSNIKIGIHDSGGTTTEITPNILVANTWQTVVWDISAVTNANKDAIDSIIVTILNADATNTFYIDNLFADIITNYIAASANRGRSRLKLAAISAG